MSEMKSAGRSFLARAMDTAMSQPPSTAAVRRGSMRYQMARLLLEWRAGQLDSELPEQGDRTPAAADLVTEPELLPVGAFAMPLAVRDTEPEVRPVGLARGAFARPPFAEVREERGTA
jgi:hypothetical protein